MNDIIKTLPIQSDREKVIKNALKNEDIFIVYGKKGVNELFADFVCCVLGSDPSVPGPGKINFKHYTDVEMYKKKAAAFLAPNFKQAQRVESLKSQISQYAATYKTAKEILQEVYMLSVTKINKPLLYELTSLMDNLYPQTHKPGPKHLLRYIYALPYNLIIYEDNGQTAIEEAVVRLKDHPQKDLFKDYALTLEALGEVCDASEPWFLKMAEFRLDLIKALYPSKNPFIGPDDKNQIADVLSRVAKDLITHQESSSKKRHSIMEDYLQEITQDVLDKYCHPTLGTKPFLCKGISIIDLDACTNEHDINAALKKSKKTILIGGYEQGLLGEFLVKAYKKSKEDNITRAVIYESKPISTMSSWVHPDSSVYPVDDLIFKTHAEGNSIGICASCPEDIKNLRLKFSSYDFKIGSLRDLYHDAFDVLYWFVAGDEDGGTLHLARSKALHNLVVVGYPNNLPKESPLWGFYHKCMGDDLYGRVYH